MESSNTQHKKQQLKRLKEQVSKYEWNESLDKFLQDSVVRNYFNFDMVSLELNEEAKKLNLNFGATHVFTNEKCRLRWSYLHLKRQLGQNVKYKSLPHQRESDDEIRPTTRIITTSSTQSGKSRNLNHGIQNSKSQQSYHKQSEPEKLIKEKTFENLIQIKNPKTMGDIEKQLWKKNIMHDIRSKKDYLDVSQEDFSRNKSISIDGREITPSNFNIFRDSLRQTSQQLLKTLNENLPDMNLHELENEDDEQEEEEEEVLPLDFRTTLIEEENKVVIQAKPLTLRTDEEILKESIANQNIEDLHKNFETTESYLDAVKKEPFKDDNIILIEPDINIKEKFDQIDLLCNKEQRINNQISAPVRTQEEIQRILSQQRLQQMQTQIQKSQAPASSKQYDTDTDNEDTSVKPINFKNQSLDFNNVLKQWGVNDLNKLIGTSSEDEKKKRNRPKNNNNQEETKDELKEVKQVEEAKVSLQSKHKNNEKSASQRISLIESIMKENRQAQLARQQQDNMPQSIDMMLTALQQDFPIQMQQKEEKKKSNLQESEEDSDVAPMSPIVDIPTKEEQKRKEQNKVEKSVKLASGSSASESEQSGTEQKKMKKVTFQQNQSDSEIEQIDTTSRQNEAKQGSKTKKVIMYKGVKIQSEDEGSDKKSGSSQSDDSADEYFNQQRKMIKNKLLGNKDVQKEFDKEDYVSGDENENEEERDWDNDMNNFDQIMEQTINEAKRVQEEEQRKARKEQERLRQEKLKQQEEMVRRDQERKQKERDELMERLKKQDEERKKRKKEEKQRKEQEREWKRKIEEEKTIREQEEKERKETEQKKQKQEEERIKQEKEQNERRKENFEKSIRKIWNGSDIPCLFDNKIAYSKQLYSLPVELEKRIAQGQVSNEDLVFRRYKCLIIPIDELISKTSGICLSELTDYFLRNSTMKKIENSEDNLGQQLKIFPFKCISFVQTVALPPFNKCNLSSVSPSDENSYRVLSLLFDTHDNPKTKLNFTDTLKQIKLTDILSEKSMKEISVVYRGFLEKLASDYFQANKIKEFPYQINAKKPPLLEFENDNDLSFDYSQNSQETIGRISFFMEYSIQDDIAPIVTKESWDFIRRYPTFYAYNPNPKSYSRIDSRDRVVTKYNIFKQESVCVIFKDISISPIQQDLSNFTQTTKSQDSLSYFLKKVIHNGLEICGMRMIYLDEDQEYLYEHLFNEKLSSYQVNHKESSLFAIFIRGVEAIIKCENIVGHYNPEMARKTNEKSVRSMFGKDKDNNCVLKMFANQKKNTSELIFWFGGRVLQESQTNEILQQSTQIPVSTMYLVVPPRLDKQFLFLSPLITAQYLPYILQVISEFGITILDIQKINYEKFQYESERIQTLCKNICLFKVRGNTYNIQIGFVLKLSKESLIKSYKKIEQKIQKQLDFIDKKYGKLIFMTENSKEYKLVKQKLRINQFNVNYHQFQLDHLKPKIKTKEQREQTDYDSEDAENLKGIQLFNQRPVLPNQAIKKAQILQPQTVNNQYKTTSFLCFLKLSLFKKQNINDVLQTILAKTNFEIIGLKILNAKKNIYNELIPIDVRTIIKKIAYKFYESSPELYLRSKILNFKSLVLVMRGRNVEQNIDKIYDKEKLKFIQDLGIYEGSPQVLFLTNQQLLDPLFDFILTSKLIKLYNDFSMSHEHLMDSPLYSYLLNHNVEQINPLIAQEIQSHGDDSSKVQSVQNIVLIKERDHLVESQETEASGGKLSACVVVIKPNQPLNVALRTLKSIANSPELGLTIQNIELVKYNERQLELLFTHDILYDETIPEQYKEKMKTTYYQLFNESKNPVIQFLVAGPYAISKVNQIIGHRDPKLASKESLRSFYGQDRIDNAFFISENFSESLIERDYLFQSSYSSLLSESQNKFIKSLSSPQVLGQSSQVNQSTLLLSHHNELALILLSPSVIENNEFVFIMDDLHRSKFTICALQRIQLEKEDLQTLFSDLAPRFFNIEILEQYEFKKGNSIMIVVEKEKAVGEIQDVVGKLEIRSKADFDKYKKKQSSSSSSSLYMFNYGNDQQKTLTQEYGPYIFTFPNPNLNQKKILKYFNSLPNSNHFVIEQQQSE